MKKNGDEEKQFHAAATNIITEEMFPDKSIKQLNAKVGPCPAERILVWSDPNFWISIGFFQNWFDLKK